MRMTPHRPEGIEPEGLGAPVFTLSHLVHTRPQSDYTDVPALLARSPVLAKGCAQLVWIRPPHIQESLPLDLHLSRFEGGKTRKPCGTHYQAV